MKTNSLLTEDLRGVFAVPPLARREDRHRSLDFEQNDLLVSHIAAGGITRFIYGGNAFLYHVTLAEYQQLLDWLSSFGARNDALWAIPSIGPSYGRAMDQVPLLARYKFPCVMMLPSSDPRDAEGIERGYREIAEAAGTKLIAYLKDEHNLGADKDAGLDMLARLTDEGVCVAIKYAVVRADPSADPYLDALLRRVDAKYVLSGIGERPAVVHLRDWKLAGFTTGSGCIAPNLSCRLLDACRSGDFARAEELRGHFIALEDLRDRWSPAKVLHVATELAGLARTGPVPPLLSSLSAARQSEIAPVARALLESDSAAIAGATKH